VLFINGRKVVPQEVSEGFVVQFLCLPSVEPHEPVPMNSPTSRLSMQCNT
jgi:hypothetical protein